MIIKMIAQYFLRHREMDEVSYNDGTVDILPVAIVLLKLPTHLSQA